MPGRRIVVLSDGTGNAASQVWRTNVWRVFELLDLSTPDQVAKYDDGIGSSRFRPFALIAGAFGFGLKRNVIDLYKFVCRNYKPGDAIYAFGFSRGAFTIRILVGLIAEHGLVPYRSEADLDARAKAAYRAMRAEHFHTLLRIEVLFRKLRDLAFLCWRKLARRAPYDRGDNVQVPSIEFVGLWDTVAAYGLPIEEMTRGVSLYIWPLYLPECNLSPKVRRACHALSIDDERTTFHPVLWNEKNEPTPAAEADGTRRLRDERISQVWFAGAHANVGGGYPDDALAHIPLLWIMQEAVARGLVFKEPPAAEPDAMLKVKSAGDEDGRQYDSRAGLGAYYRYGPRKIADLTAPRFSGKEAAYVALPKIHESALDRMQRGSTAYAPIGLPARYALAMADGRIIEGDANPYESAAQTQARAIDQERIWNWVWAKRIVYFLTLAASFHLAAFWWFHDRDPEHEYNSSFRLVSELVRLVESFLPRPAHWWADWYAANPEWFMAGVATLAALIWLGSKLGLTISDEMRRLWAARPGASSLERSPGHWMLFRARTSTPYQFTLFAMKRYVVPLASALAMLWIGATAASHLVFNMADSAGAFCRESPSSETRFLRPGESASPLAFATRQMCAPTRVLIARGGNYTIEIKVPDGGGWADGDTPALPSGFETQGLVHFANAPLRRVFFRDWMTLIARIGATGNAEIFIDPEPRAGTADTFVGRIRRAERSGELFLYVNDAVLPLPFVADAFYRDNRGTAQITVRRD